MSLSDKWMIAIYDIIDRIKTTQTENIENAAEAISNSIISNHVCFLFGSGHSIMPVIELYPRYGGLVGFMPILELPLSYFTRIIGDLGFPQFDFLENSEGYGRRIMQNYNIHKEDSMIIFSNSGSPPVIIDVALSFKEKGGGKLIGVTSLAHSKSAKSKHSCGKKLYELADIVVDNCTPAGDVVASTGLQKTGPTSTIGSVVVANLIALKTIERLSKRGYTPLMNPVRGYDPKADETMKTVLNEYSKRLLNHISQKF